MALVTTIQKMTKSEKCYTPRTHLFDPNPFPGLGVGRRGIEHKTTLTPVAAAVWGTHASWLARASMGMHVDWDEWRLGFIAG